MCDSELKPSNQGKLLKQRHLEILVQKPNYMLILQANLNITLECTFTTKLAHFNWTLVHLPVRFNFFMGS